MIDDSVDHPHLVGILCRVRTTEEEHFSRTLLADLTGEERRAITSVEGGDIGIGLLEHGVFAGGEREIAHDVQAVAAADGPPGNDGNDNLGHEPDQALHLEDVESSEPGSVDALRPFILVAIGPTNPLIAARAERPATILRRRTVARQEHRTYVGRHAGMIERCVQLIDGVRTERIANLGAIECDSNGTDLVGSVVGDVREVEPLDGVPRGWVKYLRSHEAIL